MTIASDISTYRRGVLDGLPFLIIAVPFAMLFGVTAAEAGLNLIEAFAFSTVVIAGAAQFAALALMKEQAPVLIVLATALAVNLRMAMYSAALVPHLGRAPLWQRAVIAYANFDQTYAVSIAAYEDQPNWSTAQKVGYFLGTATPLVPSWCVATVIGAAIGSAVPDWLALDFALPICFLALVGPMLRTLAHVVAAGTSVVLALLLAGLPYGTGLLLAAVAAMMAGAEVERQMSRRAGP